MNLAQKVLFFTGLTLAMLIASIAVLSSGVGEDNAPKETTETSHYTSVPEDEPIPLVTEDTEDTEDTIEVTQPIDTTPPVRYFDVPLSYELQDYIFELCDKHSVEPELVIAIIEVESTFDTYAVNETSVGLMQVNSPVHTDRMVELNATNMFNPFDNVTVGIDILAEALSRYDTVGEALTAYNAGYTGAYRHYFSKGIYANSYALKVLDVYKEFCSNNEQA